MFICVACTCDFCHIEYLLVLRYTASYRLQFSEVWLVLCVSVYVCNVYACCFVSFFSFFFVCTFLGMLLLLIVFSFISALYQSQQMVQMLFSYVGDVHTIMFAQRTCIYDAIYIYAQVRHTESMCCLNCIEFLDGRF